jgi:hypothetical protein
MPKKTKKTQRPTAVAHLALSRPVLNGLAIIAEAHELYQRARAAVQAIEPKRKYVGASHGGDLHDLTMLVRDALLSAATGLGDARKS